MASTSGVDKQLDKVQQTLKSGAYYEALQMYKTVYYRYKAKQQLDSSYHILCEGAVQQLQVGQVTSGTELGMLLVEAYTGNKAPVTEETMGRLFRIVEAFPQPVGSQKEDSTNLEECLRLVSAAVKWAHKSGSGEEARQLHDMLGRYIYGAYNLQALGLAIMHFIQGADAEALAKVLADVIPQGKPEEADLFIARCVLQTLAAARSDTLARQLEHARDLVAACKRCGIWKETPLLHLAFFVVQVLEQHRQRVFDLLRTKYKPSLDRDPILEAYLAKIESAYFNVNNGGGGMGGMLGNFMKMLADTEDD